MFQTILSSFTLVAVSEMGDKTQLLAFSLAARFKRPWAVMGGIFCATVLNHALASTVGEWVSAQISPSTMALILAVTFIGFGIWTLKPDTLDEQDHSHKYGAFVTTTVLFFLATVALAARFHSVAAVTLGTTLGMMVTDGLAVFVGEKLADKIQMKWIRWLAAGIFVLFGIASAIMAWKGEF